MTRDELQAEVNELISVGFNSVQQPWRGRETVESVENFQCAEDRSARRDASGEWPRHGSEKLKTYGRMAEFTRIDFVDGSYRQVLERLGRGAAIKLNELVAENFDSGPFKLAALNGQVEPQAYVAEFDGEHQTASVCCFCDIGLSAMAGAA